MEIDFVENFENVEERNLTEEINQNDESTDLDDYSPLKHFDENHSENQFENQQLKDLDFQKEMGKRDNNDHDQFLDDLDTEGLKTTVDDCTNSDEYFAQNYLLDENSEHIESDSK